MIRGLQDVYVNVENMDRAVSFYYDLLGLKLVEQGDHWSAFELGDGVRLGLHWTGGKPVPQVPSDSHGPLGGAVVTLEVGDIFSAVDHLTENGVKFLGEIESAGWGSLVAFEDPDGNVLKLMQPNA